jgi:hypothetical protein
MVTVAVIPKLPQDVLSRIVAVTMFGSPGCPTAVRGRCNSYCNKGDFVCSSNPKGGNNVGGRGFLKGDGGKGFPPKVGGATLLALSSPLSRPQRYTLEDMTIGTALKKRQQVADCAKYGPSAGIEATGWDARNGGSAHLAYNKDGHYVWAAACYVADAFRKSQGKIL